MSDDKKDKNEFHTLSNKGKNILIGFTLFFILVVFPAFSYKYYQFALNRPSQNFEETTFEIFDGESVTTIAERLSDKNLVNSEFLFKAYLVSEGLHKNIEVGIYKIPPGSSVRDLSQIFQHGTNDKPITFIEGWRVEQYALELSELYSDIDYSSFVDLAKSKEGFLFPDTYSFNVGVTEKEVVEKLISNYEEKTKEVVTEDVLEDLGMTEDQLINFASIVEREVSNEDDRKVVAGILVNRWRGGQLLGADATVQYIAGLNRVCLNKSEECPSEEEAGLVDWWPNDITIRELDIDSPYNTRKNVGLPPKPIANPSLSSIKSVVNYKDTAYNFYLTDENGVTHFSNTLQEHNRNIFEYLIN